MPAVEISHKIDLDPKVPDDIMDIAVKQGEDPDKVALYLDDFKRMIFEKGDCTPHRTDDAFLIKFLRARFWKQEHAYKLLCRYYKFREENPNFFEKIDPLTMITIGSNDLVNVFPYLDQNGRRVIIYKLGNWNPSKLPIEDIFRASLVLLEMGSLEVRSQVLGGVGIFDLQGFGFSHLWHLTPALAKKIVAIMVTSMPTRTASIHVINSNWAFDACYQIFKPFLTDRMRKQIFMHGNDLKSLHKHIYPDHLPTRYGGGLPEYSYLDWLANLVDSTDVVEELRKLQYLITKEDLEETKKLFDHLKNKK